MKKTLAFAASLGLAMSFSTALPTAASAASNGGVVESCKAAIDGGLDATVGECVSIFRTEGAVQLCKIYKWADLLEVLGYKNLGQCVKALNSD